MAEWALALLVVYLLFAFGVRVLVALRTTGSTGISSTRSMPAIEILGGFFFVTAILMGGANPALVLADVLEPIEGLDKTGLHAAGFVLTGVGIVGTFAAQMAMGSSWRIGVDPDETTELVTGGVFSLMRNPIYTFMIIAWIGFALLVPTWLSLAAVPMGILGLEIQVRWVEEPHLIRTHGEPYLAWARRVGRFVPGLGRLA
jgi:protein-S-isoprenylcysteine O-methyltransferase Ste14